MKDFRPFCPDPLVYRRRKTRVIRVGDGPKGPVYIGGDHPICLQSMTTTPTRDVEATVKQVKRLVDYGCELVRITAPTKQDADALGEIRKAMDSQGIRVPLVADIHFAPQAAMRASDFVEKVRINPGNFADRKRFQQRDYTDAEYNEELERIAETVLPLVKKMKELGRCMRIGTNHGSLSDRIMNRFGDSPEGMVESALEYVRICEADGYRDLVLSMKASKPEVMIAANRLLAARLIELGMDYPIHLGVTEAGAGEDGRIKSAIGIGSLLQDGVGDTIRVSLTEDPEFEIPVARDLVAAVKEGVDLSRSVEAGPSLNWSGIGFDPYSYLRTATATVTAGSIEIGGEQPIRVLEWLRPGECEPGQLGKLTRQDQALEWVNLAGSGSLRTALESIAAIRAKGVPLACGVHLQGSDLEKAAMDEWLAAGVDSLGVTLLAGASSERDRHIRSLVERSPESRPMLMLCLDTGTHTAEACWELLAKTLGPEPAAWPGKIVLGFSGRRLVPHVRYVRSRLSALSVLPPFHLSCGVEDQPDVLAASLELGALLCDGLGDSVSVGLPGLALPERIRVAYNILQGAGKRITKTEYISCPSCGRTLFDLQSTTDRIKAVTGHLKNVRIAVMGCVVNGPGEMADADFGYVGSAPGLVQLYVGKNCVERAVPEAEAGQKLVELIRAHGKWVEPPVGAGP